MRLRQLVLACGLSTLVLSHYASALGLGEVTLKSTLNQPLSAEVKLLDTRDLTAEQILVTLAAPADFERNGVDRLFFYTELRFEVVLNSSDGPKVLITSRNPVREPYLNFLLEARWTAGRLLREYTLLMDLPTFDEDRAVQQVQPTRSYQAAPQTPSVESSATASSSRVAGRQQNSTVSESARQVTGENYKVQSNDTLWEIAQRTGSSGSIHQKMMALYKANPDAFIRGNINLLRRGQVLRIPSQGEITAITKRDAANQFAQQASGSDLGAQLSASGRRNSTQTESAEVSGRVKLAAPSASAARSGQGSGANDGSGKALEGELAVTLEELDKSKAENSELSSRVRELEAQIETMERLVDVSNEKLSALQIAAKQQANEQNAIAAAPAEIPSVAAEVSPPVEVAEPQKPVVPAPAVVEAPKPVQKTIAPPIRIPTFMDKLIANAPWIGLGLAVVGALGFFVYRRRKEAGEQQAEFDEELYAHEEEFEPEPEVDAQAFDAPEEEHDALDEEVHSVEAETEDVVGEADIYIAYGKLDQAEEMLLKGLAKTPESTDIRMKLLEVYSQQENIKGFDQQYKSVIPFISGALLARADELREAIPGAADVELDTSAAAPDVIESSGIQASDFDLGDLSLDLQEPDTKLQSSTDDNDDLSFELDLDDDFSSLNLNADLAAGDALAEEIDIASDEAELDISNDEFDFSLDDDFSLELVNDDEELVQSDDVTAINMAIDDLDSDFGDLDDELDGLADDLSIAELDKLNAPAGEPASVKPSAEILEVSSDDFNLDMDVGAVDLAALDHEMESLDVDFDDEILESSDATPSLAIEEPDLVDELSDFKSSFEEDALFAGDIDITSGVKLTDDLDGASDAQTPLAVDDEELEFELLNDAELDSELMALSDEGDELSEEFEESELDDFEIDLESDETIDLSSFDASEDLNALDSDTETDELEGFALDDADEDGSLDDLAASLGSITELDEVVVDLNEGLSAAEVNSEDDAVITTDTEEPEDDLFAQALSEFEDDDANELNLNDFDSSDAQLADLSDEDMDAELDYLADADEAATKLDLARAYIDMGDAEGARDILGEVAAEGNAEQKADAANLLSRLDA